MYKCRSDLMYLVFIFVNLLIFISMLFNIINEKKERKCFIFVLSQLFKSMNTPGITNGSAHELPHIRAANAQISLCICTVSPEPSLLAYAKEGTLKHPTEKSQQYRVP